MDAAPPSYDEATSKDCWRLIATYLPTKDLCSAALVSSHWHSTFVPHLWGNPALHFHHEDLGYTALTRFLRALRIARLFVRSYSHTFELCPARSELHEGLKPDWLREILDRLPHLQSLIVRGLPFFDHAALLGLNIPPFQDSIAVSRSNTTRSSGLFNPNPPSADWILSQRPILKMLDASQCSNVTSHALEQALPHFESVIYLDLSFTQSARSPSVLARLRTFSGLQVLNLRGIGLNDRLVAILAAAIGRRVRSLDIRDNLISDQGVQVLCNECFATANHIQFGTLGGDDELQSLSSRRSLGPGILPVDQGANFECHLRRTLTRRLTHRLVIEDVLRNGITHLYVAGNRLSFRGASALIQCNPLVALDIGVVAYESFSQNPGRFALQAETFNKTVSSVHNLLPMLRRHCASSLTYLRIHHALVTQGERDTWAESTQLPTHNTLEVAGEGSSHRPSEMRKAELAIAPVSISKPQALNNIGGGRGQRRAIHMATSTTFHPAMLPLLQKLVLTDLPAVSETSHISEQLIWFVKQCAEERWAARRRARQDYAAPPGREGDAVYLEYSTRNYFALREIVLEVTRRNARPNQRPTREQYTFSGIGSVTEDHDSEKVWRAAVGDFSFFSDKDEGQELSGSGNVRSAYLHVIDDNDQSSGSRVEPHGAEPSEVCAAQEFDNIRILSTFRTDRRLLHTRRSQHTSLVVETEGFWDGLIRVVQTIAVP